MGMAKFKTKLSSLAVGCIPEGIAGITKGATIEAEAIYAKARTGIIRVAIIAGAGVPQPPAFIHKSCSQTSLNLPRWH